MRASRLMLACIALALGCSDDEPVVVATFDDYEMPRPRPIAQARGVPIDDATFAIDARDVRLERDGATARVAELGLRDLRLAGSTRGGRLLPARLTLDMPGRPRLTGTLAARATTDARGALHVDGSAVVGRSRVTGNGTIVPAGGWRADLRLDPLVLADAVPFVENLPARGVARGTIALAGGAGALRASTGGLTLETDSSRIRLAGAIGRGASGRWSFDDVRLALESVHPDDWRAWLGAEPPVDAPLTGELTADGNGRDGIDVAGWVLAEANDGARLAADVDGRFWLEPRPRLDLTIESRALRLADQGPFDLDVRLSGHADSLVVVGGIRLGATEQPHPLLDGLPAVVVDRIRTGTLDIDAIVLREGASRRVAGSATLIDSAGRAIGVVEGSAPMGGAGELDVSARLDSVPLTVVPVPSAIRNLEGFARLSARARGTVSEPAIEADVALSGVRFDVPEYGTGVDSMRVGVRLAGDRVELIDARAWHAEGSLALVGGIDLAGPLDLRAPAAAFDGATLDVRAVLDTMTVVDMDSARAVVTGHLAARGPLRRPHVTGTVAVLDGFAYEGKLAPDPPLDPDDPPYSDLLATAPWPSTSLRAAARQAEAGAGPPRALPLTADITATVAPGFRVIDEDSDLGVHGGVRLVIDERGAYASGDARIVDGFYAYYGELFRMTGGAFSVADGAPKLAMAGVLRDDYRPLGLGQGGYPGFDRRDPPIGIFGYSTPATVLELLRRNSPLPATQPELAALLLFDVPLQPIDAWRHELAWRGDEPADLIGQRSAIQGAGLAWSYLADELYDYLPIDRGYLRAGTLRVGSRYPGWLMLGTQLGAGLHFGDGFTVRATHVVGADAAPGVGLRYALRRESTEPADRHIELFNEPRFSTTRLGAGHRDDIDVRRRTGLRIRWRWDY